MSNSTHNSTTLVASPHVDCDSPSYLLEISSLAEMCLATLFDHVCSNLNKMAFVAGENNVYIVRCNSAGLNDDHISGTAGSL